MSAESVDILVILPHLGAGGAQRVATNLASAWYDSGLRVEVVTLNGGITDAFKLPRGVRRTPLSIDFPHFPALANRTGVSKLYRMVVLVRRLHKLRKIFQERSAPVVLSFIAVTNIMCILSSLGLRHKLVVSERNDPARQSNGFLWGVARQALYRYADVVTANSRGALSSMRRYVSDDKLRFLPNPINGPSVVEPLPHKGKVFLAMGRLVEQKGYDVLLRAFDAVARQLPEWRLRFVGDGPLEAELRRLEKALGLKHRVEWVGHVEDSFECLRSADVFVLPSRFEGTPNALLEAMHCGLPVIVSNASPGPLELVENGSAGLVVRANDETALGNAMLALARDAGLRAKLGEKARESVRPYELHQVIGIWNGILELGIEGSTSEGEARVEKAELFCITEE